MAHRVAPEAETELDNIWDYVAKDSGNCRPPHRFHCRAFLPPGLPPAIGRRRDEDLRPGLRSFPVGEYVIIYRLKGEDVLILHVLRGSRNIEALLPL